MSAALTAIYRYPVKGLSAEALDRVTLTEGACLPDDRRFAVALGTTKFDPAHPDWLPKTSFVMLMRDESLARLATRFDAKTGRLSIARAGRILLDAPIGEPEGGRRVARFLEEFLAGSVAGPLRVVAALDRHFGHNLMGVYAEVAGGGEIAVGDALTASP